MVSLLVMFYEHNTWANLRLLDFCAGLSDEQLQAINHATEHRAHVATILSQHGVAPPELDGWTYDEEKVKP